MRKPNKKKIFFSLLLASMMIVTIWLAGCTEQSPSGDTSGTTSGLISAKDAWDKVRPEVETWDPGYKIAWIDHFGNHWSEDAKEQSWEFYVESADGATSTTFTYPINNGVSKEADTPFGTGRYTFQASDWMVDSTQAASIALNAINDNTVPGFNGGLKAVMYANEDDIPYWDIDYDSQRKNGEIDLDLPSHHGDVKINAKTGEIIDITGS